MKISRLLGIVLILFSASFALAEGRPDIEKGPSCELCEMSRDKFSHSRAVIEWEDGTETSLCSLNCVAAKLDPAPALKVKRIMVADYDTKELVDASKAFWVAGGSERGVMTKEPKWAFASDEGADNFIKSHGGEKITYEEAMKRAMQDIKRRMQKKPESSSMEKMEPMNR
ncbi:NosL family protein [bacterium]|nr:MAG: NosL family protein [bacterium]